MHNNTPGIAIRATLFARSIATFCSSIDSATCVLARNFEMLLLLLQRQSLVIPDFDQQLFQFIIVTHDAPLPRSALPGATQTSITPDVKTSGQGTEHRSHGVQATQRPRGLLCQHVPEFCLMRCSVMVRRNKFPE
jgi:hypothetical protein